MDLIQAVARLSQGAAQRLQVRSALNPLLWLSVSVGIICLSFAYVFRDYVFLRNLLAVFGCLPGGVSCLIGVYFAMKHPEKLQSEDYQIKQQTLHVIEQKAGSIKLAPAALESIIQTATRRLESGDVAD